MNHPAPPASDPDGLHRAALDILHRWGLSRGECETLLTGGDRRSRRRAGKGAGSSLLTETQRTERLQHIIAIYRAVSQTFPQSPLLADLWITTPHFMLADKTPLQVILERGIEGMTSIRQMLDGDGSWAGI